MQQRVLLPDSQFTARSGLDQEEEGTHGEPPALQYCQLLAAKLNNCSVNAGRSKTSNIVLVYGGKINIKRHNCSAAASAAALHPSCYQAAHLTDISQP